MHSPNGGGGGGACAQSASADASVSRTMVGVASGHGGGGGGGTLVGSYDPSSSGRSRASPYHCGSRCWICASSSVASSSDSRCTPALRGYHSPPRLDAVWACVSIGTNGSSSAPKHASLPHWPPTDGRS